MQQVDLTQSKWEALLDRQRELEDSAMAEGAARFKRRLEEACAGGSASMVGAARKLLQEGLVKLEDALTELTEKKRTGPRHVAERWIVEVGPNVAAYMTLKVVLDVITQRVNIRKAAFRISELLFDELRYRRFWKEAPQLFEYKLKSFHTSNYSHMARSLNASMNFANVDTSDLDAITPSVRLRLGLKLIDLLIEHTGLVEIVHENAVGNHKRKRLTRTSIVLRATPATMKWLEMRNTAMEFLQPIVMPMVVPPLKWEPNHRGGYRFALRGKYTLVRDVSRARMQTLADTNMPIVYEALNTIQNTAWRINAKVFALVSAIRQAGGDTAGLPPVNDERLPAKPFDIDTNEEARKAWRRAAHAVKERNHLRRQKAVEVAKVLAAAEGVKDERAIFFPYSLDFRGRIYPIAAYLTPQGDDLSRSLLMFADGRPVDEQGAKWLAIHGANCMGVTLEGQKVSKMTFTDRHAWVCKRTAEILQWADEPLKHQEWMKAEDPLQFYAFCVEWANLVRANERDEEYVCALPCSMDGSCNGLQHFSAMLLDDVGGRAVNVVPQSEPQDIYEHIAESVRRKLVDEAAGDPVAALWVGLHNSLGLVDRKLCKRPTMTFGYGSKRFGFKKQIHEYLRGLEDWSTIRAHFVMKKEDGKEKPVVGIACSVMSKLIWEALREVVVAAFDGMAWMQKATRGVVKQNKPVEWIVPGTSFPVRQEYYKWERERVKTMLAGSVCKPSVYHVTKNVNPIKQANAIAPNFVHSLDAAALMLTVQAAAAEGVEQFAMIHDSYGTVPSDCAVMARCCRQAFAALYTQHDVIAELYSQLAAHHEDPTECPAPPAKGELDVSYVLASEYFFA